MGNQKSAFAPSCASCCGPRSGSEVPDSNNVPLDKIQKIDPVKREANQNRMASPQVLTQSRPTPHGLSCQTPLSEPLSEQELSRSEQRLNCLSETMAQLKVSASGHYNLLVVEDGLGQARLIVRQLERPTSETMEASLERLRMKCFLTLQQIQQHELWQTEAGDVDELQSLLRTLLAITEDWREEVNVLDDMKGLATVEPISWEIQSETKAGDSEAPGPHEPSSAGGPTATAPTDQHTVATTSSACHDLSEPNETVAVDHARLTDTIKELKDLITPRSTKIDKLNHIEGETENRSLSPTKKQARAKAYDSPLGQLLSTQSSEFDVKEESENRYPSPTKKQAQLKASDSHLGQLLKS